MVRRASILRTFEFFSGHSIPSSQRWVRECWSLEILLCDVTMGFRDRGVKMWQGELLSLKAWPFFYYHYHSQYFKHGIKIIRTEGEKNINTWLVISSFGILHFTTIVLFLWTSGSTHRSGVYSIFKPLSPILCKYH